MSKKSTVFAFDFTTGTGNSEETQTRQIERGALVALVLQTSTANIRKADCYVRVEVLTGGGASEHSAAVLIEDYIYNIAPANWNGLYPLAAQSILRMTTIARVATTIRLTGTINIEE